MKVKKADHAVVGNRYDIILANIKKNVILDNLSHLVKHLAHGGIILFSGLLVTDKQAILDKMGKFLLNPGKKMLDNNWISLIFSR